MYSSSFATHSSRNKDGNNQMAIDVLQDVLATIRLRGIVADVTTLAAPWGFATLPKDHDMAFLAVIKGSCVLELRDSQQPVYMLQSGDIVVLPGGDDYVLHDTLHTPILPLADLETRPQKASGEKSTIASGCYQFVDVSKHPIFSMLPRIIHLRADDHQSAPELDLVIRLFIAEAAQEGACKPAILSRLAEVLFMQMLRMFSMQTLENQSGWLRGLSDPPIAAALQAIHANPAAPWTVANLAELAHLSRSAFAERFTTIVGETPLHYVQHWRIQRAAHLLTTGKQPLKKVIAMSGYASEAAFRKAFQHWIGVLPGQYRANTHSAESQVSLLEH
jgi:AraC-like DNA-binding protein